MKHLTALLVFVFIYSFSDAQSVKPNLRVSIGFHQSDLYSKKFYSQEAITTVITKQESLLLPEIMLTATFPSKSLVAPFVGIGINAKGYRTTNYDISFNPIMTFEKNIFKTYLSIPVGLEFSAIKQSNFKLALLQSIVPEFFVGSGDVYKKVGVSSRTQLFFEFTTSGKKTFHVAPYFHSSLGTYSKPPDYLISDKRYRPYAIGLALGYNLR